MRPFNERQIRDARSNLVRARGRVETLQHEDPEVAGFLLRVVEHLELLNRLPPYDDDGGGPLFERAFRSLLPMLELDWENREPRDRAELSDGERATIQVLLQERSIMAQECMASPHEWAHHKTALLDLLAEGLQVLTVYPDENAQMWCLALLVDLTKRGTEECEEVAEGGGWVC
ncbi:MAG: hypothetical protein GY719_12385 [bacterium]|nr:hypothetical protein [bacterium]